MLKYAREYLKKRFEKVNNELKTRKLIQAQYDELKARYQEGKRYINAYKAQDKAINNLTGDCLFYFIITVLIGAAITVSLKPFTIPFFIGMTVLLGCDAFRIGTSIRTCNKAKKEFREVKASTTLFTEEELQNIDEFERDLYRQTEHKMELNDIGIEQLTREVKALWDILSSDDFEAALIRQDKNTDEIARALYKEWEAYLDELDSKHPVNYSNPKSGACLLESSICDDSYKESTKNFLMKTKKIEKEPHHPLSTY